MRDGHMEAALQELEGRLQSNPYDTDAHYLSAVCARYLRRYEQAERHLDALLTQRPEDGRGLQELAHLHRDREQKEQAIAAYAQALRANPALLASYENQITLLRLVGRSNEASAVEAQFKVTAKLPPPVLAASDLLAQGRLVKAEQLCRQYLQTQPHQTDAMRLLAEIGIRLGALEEAQFLLESACELKPDDTRLRIDLIRVLGKRQRFSDSLAESERLLQRAPDNLQFQSIRAIECLQLGRYAEAIAGFEAILEKLPHDTVTLTSLGHALKTCGDTQRAIKCYRAASDAEQASGESWYALANLKTYPFDTAQIQSMRRRLERRAPLMDQVHLSFALAKALEDQSEFAESFQYYEHGNRLKHAQLRYGRDSFREEVDAQIEQVEHKLLTRQAQGGFPASDPIFILGMPRAGSTLLEQIIASHSCIEGTRELPNVLALAQRLRRRADSSGGRPGYPQILQSMDTDQLYTLGRDYIEQTRIHRGAAPYFIDKMPNNFRHIGLISLMLPNAKIIDARREPMACCFSNYKQLFAEGQEFSYELTDLGHYYRDYERLMTHWERALPGRVYRLQHEKLLDDLEGELQELFSFLEIPFERQCLRFYESTRPVRTPSSEQVRQPLFRDAQEQWKNYAPWLDPLTKALDNATS